MKFLLEIFEKSGPLFKEGGKLEKLYPLYEAKDTFLFTPGDITKKGAHVRDFIDMKRMMITVVLAMIPCILIGMYNAGHQHLLVNGGVPSLAIISALKNQCLMSLAQGAFLVLPIIIVSYAVGGIWEVIFAIVRKHEINEGFLVTGMLVAMICPPTIPLWQVAIGVSFGVVIGKEVFGGTGMNILNPALTARAFLFFSYPGQMSGDNVWTNVMKEDVTIFGCTLIEKSNNIVAGFSGATPLSVAAALKPGDGSVVEVLNSSPYGSSAGDVTFSFMDMFMGNIGGSIGETSTLACIIGAAILIGTGVGSWRIMLSGVIGLLASSAIFGWGASALMGDNVRPFFMMPGYYHIVMGGFAFGIVFMATDPVSAAVSDKGKWIYGLGIGLLVYIIRVINPAYPEGVMLAILFMNMMAPLIDHYVVEANIKRRLARGAK